MRSLTAFDQHLSPPCWDVASFTRHSHLQDDLYAILPALSILELVIILIYLGHISGCFFYLLSTPSWQTKGELCTALQQQQHVLLPAVCCMKLENTAHVCSQASIATCAICYSMLVLVMLKQSITRRVCVSYPPCS